MRIVLFGTGNLATRLGLELQSKHAEIVQVFGRTASSCSHLAALLGCQFTLSKEDVRQDADLFLFALSESALPEVLTGLPVMNQLIVHTSGSLSLDCLSAWSSNFGVFYPLQTLSAQKEVDFSTIPICIEANTPKNQQKLADLANSISQTVRIIDSSQRRQLHLAAVYACNFVNHLYAIGEKLLMEHQLDFELLKPLIRETAEKALQFSPADVQTGPAMRGNHSIQQLHLQMLEQHPAWQQIYQQLSQDIASTQT